MSKIKKGSALWLLPICFIGVLTSCKPKAPETPSRTIPRSDFAPEEFGVGRKHTQNATCNRQIDELLNEVRVCYNHNPSGGCDGLQKAINEKIARIKNAVHCAH